MGVGERGVGALKMEVNNVGRVPVKSVLRRGGGGSNHLSARRLHDGRTPHQVDSINNNIVPEQHCSS